MVGRREIGDDVSTTYVRCNGTCPAGDKCCYKEWRVEDENGPKNVYGTLEYKVVAALPVPISDSVTKSRPDLFPAKALLLAGDVLAFGETKHPDSKWLSMSVAEHIGASLRHLLKWQSGEKLDSETSRSHLAHSMVRLAMAVELEAKQ